MDLLRSCYSTMMRLDLTQPSLLTPVRWYFADDGAPVLPFPTVFASLNWASSEQRGEDSGSLGEVGGSPRSWVNGSAPAGPRGFVPCGSSAQFQSGQVLPTQSPVGFTTPACCALSATLPCVTDLTWTGGTVGHTSRSVLGAYDDILWNGVNAWDNFAMIPNYKVFWQCGITPPFTQMDLNLSKPDLTGGYNLQRVSYNSLTKVYTYVDNTGIYPFSPLGTIWTVSP